MDLIEIKNEREMITGKNIQGFLFKVKKYVGSPINEKVTAFLVVEFFLSILSF